MVQLDTNDRGLHFMVLTKYGWLVISGEGRLFEQIAPNRRSSQVVKAASQRLLTHVANREGVRNDGIGN